ncbi:MAG TPA: hypothetical protein VF813_10595, partial [Anaerolineaceae bacterium]
MQPTVASALPATTASPVPTRTPAPTLTPTLVPSPVGQEDTGWNLVFQDDFSSGKLDDSKWVTCFWWDKNGCTIASNHELQWYQPANVMIMEEGGLALQAQKNQVTGSDGTVYPYTSGVITTGRKVEDKSQPVKFAFQYGYAEIQAWVPSG